MRTKIEKRRKDRRDKLRELVAEAIRDGSFRKCEPSVIVSAWGGTVGWLLESYERGRELEPEEFVEEIVTLFLRGLLANSRKLARRESSSARSALPERAAPK